MSMRTQTENRTEWSGPGLALKTRREIPGRSLGLLTTGFGLLLPLYGCGSWGVPNVTTYKVEGQVLLADGKPLHNGRVTFVPNQSDGSVLPANGEVGEDGRFSLTTNQPGDGAAAGEYRVRIAPTTSAAKPAKLPFPLKYSDVDSSGIEVTLKAEPTVLPPFRLRK